MSKIDIDKFLCDFLDGFKPSMGIQRGDFQQALRKQGYRYENGKLVEIEPKKISFKDNKEYEESLITSKDKVKVIDWEREMKYHPDFREDILGTITDTDVENMVNRRFLPMMGSHDLEKCWYMKGILDTLAEIRKKGE